MRGLIALVLGVTLALGASPARAQSASETAAARGLFEQGVAAATAHDWPEARALFERSYALAPRASTLLNLAGAQVETGQLVAATESYRRVIVDAGRSARDRRVREQAETALGWVLPRLASVTLSIPNLGADDAIALDDLPIARAIVGTATPVNPGSHVVVVTRGQREIGRAAFELAEGASTNLTVVLRAAESSAVAVADDAGSSAVPDAAITADAERSSGGDDIVTSSWLWTVVGVVVVGGVVAAVLATTLSASPSYYSGNLGDGQIRF